MERIYGGQDAEIETFPYQVSIQYFGVHQCGGSIISPNFVITTAHTIETLVNSTMKKYLSVRAGTSYRTAGGTAHKVVKIIPHEDFTTVSRNNKSSSELSIHDIALLQVEPPFVFDDTHQAVELFSENEILKVGENGIITGWGLTEQNVQAEKLQAVGLPVLSRELCLQIYGKYTRLEGQFCSGLFSEGGKDACNGDSGGPFAIDGRLAGIIAWGVKDCGNPNFPGVYTNIPYYRKWIRKHANV